MIDRKVAPKQDAVFRTNAVQLEPDDFVASEHPDNPLPIADPAIAPMRRPCMERGCQYRNWGVVYGGWLLALLAFLVNVAIGHDLVQVRRERAAMTVERDTLRAQFLP